MPFYLWSQTPASNGTADPTAQFPEGMSPAAINDGARGIMARLREYANDVAGAIVTTGTLTSYLIASNQGFDSLAHLSGQVIAFSPHVTSGATVVLNVDGLGAKPLRTSPGVELQSGVLIQGTPYAAVYNNTDGAFYLFGVGAAPGIPLAAGMDYWASTTPGSAFAFPAGQAISRTTYAALFALLGTTYGVGDGSTTFNLPDKTGRVSAMLEAVGTRLTTAKVGVDGGTLGSAGGGTQTLVTTNLPAYTPAGGITNGAITATSNQQGVGSGSPIGNGGGSVGAFNQVISVSQVASTFAGTPQGGSSAPINIAQPTIVCNYIIRIL